MSTQFSSYLEYPSIVSSTSGAYQQCKNTEDILLVAVNTILHVLQYDDQGSQMLSLVPRMFHAQTCPYLQMVASIHLLIAIMSSCSMKVLPRCNAKHPNTAPLATECKHFNLYIDTVTEEVQ